jgi:hypothetical protein
MLVELHVEASGAEVGTLQTPGRQFVRGKDGEVDRGAANAPHRRTEKRLKEACAASNAAASNEADNQTKVLEVQEPLLSAQIPTVAVIFRIAPLGQKRTGKMAQQSRFGGGLHQNMSADTVSNEEAQSDEPAPSELRGTGDTLTLKRADSFSHWRARVGGAARNGKLENLDMNFLLKNFHLPLPPPSRGGEKGPVDYLLVTQPSNIHHAGPGANWSQSTFSMSVSGPLDSGMQEDAGLEESRMRGDAAQHIVDLRQCTHAGEAMHEGLQHYALPSPDPRPACKSKRPDALEGGLEGSRDGLSPHFQAPSPRGVVRAGAGRSDGRSVKRRSTRRWASPWEGRCASTSSKQVFIFRA